MILCSPVDGLDQTEPVTTTFEPDAGQLGVSAESGGFALPAQARGRHVTWDVPAPGATTVSNAVSYSD